LCPRAGSLPATVLPGVIALTGHAQQACHAGDLVVRLLRVHQLEPFLRGGFDAKKAAAFPKNALSASSSWTRRRRLFSSSRSVAANGASGPGAGPGCAVGGHRARSEEHTSELQSRFDLVCRLLLEKKKCIK